MNIFHSIVCSPISAIIGLVLHIRHQLYDAHILRSFSVNIPTICVGNLALGGTGKTPHVEYLIRQLSKHYRVAVLSRGYGRKSRGFVLATPESTVAQIGDEPLQIARKFPSIPVAVCKNRAQGVHKLQQLFPDLQVVILDDAIQHRSIRCGLTILLSAYDNLYVNDSLWPLGTLRDLRYRAHKTNIIIITKCPDTMLPIDRRVVETRLHKAAFQQLYFSSLKYAPLPEEGTPLIVTGIANPKPLVDYVQLSKPKAELLAFPDHHIFTQRDVNRIFAAAEHYDYVLTTEKDLPRLEQVGVAEALGDKLQVVPIEVQLIQDEDQLIKKLSEYISKIC
ncbi:MAG: tetraacyldisaccharide 4'-kinase [Paludibacteraceae bacterium]|nr:tetraacyldisaccharide 4'-kinase [Paludibacteraceae bacterium]